MRCRGLLLLALALGVNADPFPDSAGGGSCSVDSAGSATCGAGPSKHPLAAVGDDLDMDLITDRVPARYMIKALAPARRT